MACEEIAPKALIGVSHFAGESCAEGLCAIAAGQLSVRFVLGFGPDLPDGVASLDVVLAVGKGGVSRPRGTGGGKEPALVTFTARAGCPLLPVLRGEDAIIAQGANDGGCARAGPPGCDPQSLSADWTGGARAWAHALAESADRRSYSTTRSTMRSSLSRFSPPAPR